MSVCTRPERDSGKTRHVISVARGKLSVDPCTHMVKAQCDLAGEKRYNADLELTSSCHSAL